MNKYIQIDFKINSLKHSEYETVIKEFINNLENIGVDDIRVNIQDYDYIPF